MIDACSASYVDSKGEERLRPPVTDLWPFELLEILDQPFVTYIQPVFHLDGITTPAQLTTYKEAYVAYAKAVKRLVRNFWNAPNAQVMFNNKEKDAAARMTNTIATSLGRSWSISPSTPIYLPTKSYLESLTAQWSLLEPAMIEVSNVVFFLSLFVLEGSTYLQITNIIEPLSRNGANMKGTAHHHDLSLVATRHLMSDSNLKFDQNAVTLVRRRLFYIIEEY
jgi:hypothetical protein